MERQNSNELAHYGVLGMKWGVRRNARVLSNARRNKAVRDAKNKYREGKIDSSKKRAAIRGANTAQKQYMKTTKSNLKSMNRKQISELDKSFSKSVSKEVTMPGLKKGMHTVNHVLTGITLGTAASSAAVGIGSAAIAGVLPAVAPLYVAGLGSTAVSALGRAAIYGRVVDRMS